MTEAPAAPLKVCVVVGLGGGGIGDKVAEKWSAEGYAVALLARRKENLAEIAAAIPNSKAYECDASVSEQVYAVVALITEEMGPIDTLIYNVGSGTFKPFEVVHKFNVQLPLSRWHGAQGFASLHHSDATVTTARPTRRARQSRRRTCSARSRPDQWASSASPRPSRPG